MGKHGNQGIFPNALLCVFTNEIPDDGCQVTNEVIKYESTQQYSAVRN